MKINKIKIILSLILLGFCSQNVFAMQEEKRPLGLGKRGREEGQEERKTRANNNPYDYVPLEYMPNEIVANIFMSILRDYKLSVMDRLKKVKSLSGVCHRFRDIFLNLYRVSEDSFPKDLPKIYLAAALDLPDFVLTPGCEIDQTVYDLAIVFRAKNLWNILIAVDTELAGQRMAWNMQYLTVKILNSWVKYVIENNLQKEFMPILQAGSNGIDGASSSDERYFFLEACCKNRLDIIEFLIQNNLISWQELLSETIAYYKKDDLIGFLRKLKDVIYPIIGKNINYYFVQALEFNNLNFIKYFIEEFGFDFSKMCGEGKTPLEFIFFELAIKFPDLNYYPRKAYESSNRLLECFGKETEGNLQHYEEGYIVLYNDKIARYNSLISTLKYLLSKGARITNRIKGSIQNIQNPKVKEDLLKIIEEEQKRLAQRSSHCDIQ